MLNKSPFLSLFFLILISLGFGQNSNAQSLPSSFSQDSIGITLIKTNTLFNSNQNISLLTLQKSSFDTFNIEFGYSPSDLKTTSFFGESNNAEAAINGGFFNMDSGGSVTYFEVNDSIINRTRDPKLKWGVSDSLMNGAIVLSKDFKNIIQSANSELFYEASKQESAVLVTGPLLLLNSEILKLPNNKFVTNHHPRTCLCETQESVLFITIDGRKKEAEGMNLMEAQQFLLSLGCIDAINLDGGGSTTMWVKGKGIVNTPSGSAERRVANVLLIKKKDNN